MSDILYEFAYSNLKGRVVHISEISEMENGAKCKCICVNCGKTMIAKIGNRKRRPHFSHVNCTDICNPTHANESALHKLSKYILEINREIKLPAFYLDGDIDPSCNKYDKKQVEKLKCFDDYIFEYDNVRVEEKVGDIIPDIILSSSKGEILIEIAVTHNVDVEKKSKIKIKKISCIEVNLRKFHNKFDFKELENVLIKEVKLKHWIYNKREEEYFLKLIERNKKLQKRFLSKTINREEVQRGINNIKESKIEEDTIGVITCNNMDEIYKNINSTSQVRDITGCRYAKCIICGKIDKVTEFNRYGTPTINEGVCRICSRKRNS